MDSFIENAESRHQHYLERFKTGEYNSLLPFLKRLEAQLILRLSKSKTFKSQKRIRELLSQIQKDAEIILAEYSGQLTLDLGEFATAEGEFTAKTITKGVSLDTTVPSPIQLIAAANARPFNSTLLKDSLKDFPKTQAKFIRNSVAQGFAEGATNAQIINDVIGSSELNFKDGSMQITRNAASRLVRTSIQHTAMTAKQAVYAQNSDIIKKYAWISTLDSRTSPTCKARDGRVYIIDKGPLPPAHPNCRSTTIPVFKGDSIIEDGQEQLNLEIGTRSSKGDSGGKQVSVKNNYNSWLGKQSKSFQVDALGETKAELFRKGGLTVDKFVDRLDKPLTLDELKNTYPTAWEKAKLT